jgi:hypothetical protein
MPVLGNVIQYVECDIDDVDRFDAPVVVQIAATDKTPAVDVRYYQGSFYVPAHQDEQCGEMTPAIAAANGCYEMHGKRVSIISMLRSIIKEAHGDYSVSAYQHMVMRLNDADRKLPGWQDTVSVDNIFCIIESEYINSTKIKEDAKAAYETNIIIDDVFWRKCAEPRYVATISSFGNVTCDVRVSVEPLTLGPTFDLKQINEFGNEQGNLVFRLDRFDDLEDAIKGYQSGKVDLNYEFTQPSINDSSILSFNDEAYSLQRNAAFAVERGWEGLKSDTDSAAFAWADLRKVLSLSVNDGDDDSLDLLADKMQNFAASTNDEDIRNALQSSLKRWEMRPLYVQSHRM